MKIKQRARVGLRSLKIARSAPKQTVDSIDQVPTVVRGQVTANEWRSRGTAVSATDGDETNVLRRYFENHHRGRGLHKWRHYFDIYERHFRKFVGRAPHVVEIGVSAGGSLEMWHSYFGDGTRLYGVDILPACKKFEDEKTKIFIGDQGDRGFWRRFREQVPRVDILIDDGGHLPEQQIVTAEEMLPHLQPGGVFLCEDVHSLGQPFLTYARSLTESLFIMHPEIDARGQLRSKRSSFQEAVASVHYYPFIVVVELHETTPPPFFAPKHGDEWMTS